MVVAVADTAVIDCCFCCCYVDVFVALAVIIIIVVVAVGVHCRLRSTSRSGLASIDCEFDLIFYLGSSSVS